MKELRIFLTMLLLSIVSVGFAGTIVFGDLELENGVQYTSPFDGGDFTVTFAGGGNDGKYYTTGSGIRVYGGGTMTIAAKSGTLTSITVTFDGSNKPTSGDVVDAGSYDAETGVWTGSANEVTFTRPSGSGHWRVQKVEATVSGGVTKQTANVTIDATTIEIGEDANVNTNGPALTLTSSDEDIVSVNGTTITGEAAGKATITATWAETSTFYGGTKSFEVTVIDPNAEETGTEENPYTVEQAIAAIDAGTGTEGVYAKGIVSKIVTAYNSQYGNISYNISADGTTSGPQLQAYRGFDKDGAWFTSADDIKVGDIVVIYGNLTKHNTTYEFAQGNQLVSKVRTDNREPAGLSYDVANFTATIGEANEFPVLANPNDLAVTFSSTNEAIATVDATTGEITLIAAGQTTIKAAFAGDDAYEPGEASYLLVVKEKEIAGTDKFELVTDASSLAEGDVIILAYVNEEGDAWAMSTTQNANNRAANSVEIEEDGTIIPGSSIQQITLEDGFYFNVGNGYLYAAASDKNYLRTEAEADDNAKANISIADNGDATIVFQGANTRNHMRFNSNNGNPMFSCYAEDSRVETLPRIYKKVQEETVPVTIGSTGYATLYYSDKTLEIPEDVSASIVTSVDKGNITFEEFASVIPAGTGVVLQGAPGSYDFVVTEGAEAPTNNMLSGSDVAATTVGEGDCKFYQLSLNAAGTEGSIGFYWGAADGGAFTNGAHKAYLVVPAEQAKAMGYSFNGIVTGIRSIGAEVENGEIYTIGGVRVKADKLQKGIYIVNGKKMVVK